MKGLIVSGGVDTPIYQVKLIHDTAWHDKEVNEINASIAKISDALAKAKRDYVDAVIEQTALQASASLADFATVQDKIDQASYKKSRYTALIRIANDRLTFITANKVQDTIVEVHCADYTLGLSGEVGLCEQLLAGGAKRYTIYPDAKDQASPLTAIFQDDVSGKLAAAEATLAESEAQKTIDEKQLAYMKSLYDLGSIPKAKDLVDGVRISFAKLQATLGKIELAKKQVIAVRRGMSMVESYAARKSAYILQNDGRQVESFTMPPRAWYINAAREPWRYKWKPQYAKGVVTAKDDAAGTLDVDYDASALGVTSLQVHNILKKKVITADYMGTGGTSMYEIGDEVLVEFPSFNPELPIINGFSVDPRPPYLWADSKLIAIDYVKHIGYSTDSFTGKTFIYSMTSGNVVGNSWFDQFDYVSMQNSGAIIEMIGATVAGYFILTSLHQENGTRINEIGLTYTFTEIYTRYEFTVDESHEVFESTITVDDRSYTHTEPTEVGVVPNIGAWAYIQDPQLVPTPYTLVPSISGIVTALSIRRLSDYNYSIENGLQFEISGINLSFVSSTVGIAVYPFFTYVSATSSPVGTVGALSSIYNVFKGNDTNGNPIYGDVTGWVGDFNGTASVYDLTDLAGTIANHIIGYVHQEFEGIPADGGIDLYTISAKTVVQSSITGATGRDIHGETFFDKAGVKNIQYATGKLKWVYGVDWNKDTFI